MKKLLPILILLFSLLTGSAQEPTKGTIRVKKKGKVHSVIFDNVNNRLIGKDVYGNIMDSAVVAFDVMITIKGIAYSESVAGTTLSPLMQNRIDRIDGDTKLFFTNIKVKEKNGNYLDWPKFNVKLGNAYDKFDD